MARTKILFICKKNGSYGFITYCKKSSGLFNSTRFIVEALQDRGIGAEIVEVVDNNCIDRVVHQFKPDIVVVEALWVVPEKFDVLKRLHPRVDWYVHLHSDIPFLAMEGCALLWLDGYAAQGVGIITNLEEAYHALRVIYSKHEVQYLPNVYLSDPKSTIPKQSKQGPLDIACLGAIRPMKNQLLQALAAIDFAKDLDRGLRFHINSSRVEQKGDSVLKNLRQLFTEDRDFELVEHPWMEPADLLEFLRGMDMGMQVSLTETFNVVTADYVSAGVPVVVSDQVKWVNDVCKADANSIDDIVDRMKVVFRNSMLARWNQLRLLQFSIRAQREWIQFVRD